ncbi:hypothetical protein PYH37_004047 [Sinorhizobium numidicum]|uniref:Uncharacterized protein n=1 Tax=Sinorhizobium numidicum TaxID=680248 RepID=A0ABY8CWD2_9HYPH|nr:hypothetical protein [Sinorhizobium numidicum]WEX79064.1 hypothetical protein PYH37_004047 [Sinorhizobium numidicum]WEX82462.1 hypothetical protein PYH38_004759 [Sinorhizobium numidicum]
MAQITQERGRHAETASEAAAIALADPRLARSTDQSRLLVCALAAIGFCTLAAASAAVLVPHVRPLLLQEDGIIEMASVVCLAIAAFGAGAASAIWGLRTPLVVAGLIGLAELLDETSFGSRVFGFEPPELYGGGELDGFHDLLILAYRLLNGISSILAWLWVGLMLAVSAGAMLFAARQLGNGLRGAGSWLTDHILIFLHIGFIGLAQVIDVATDSRALSAVEEMLELNAAFALVFYVAQQAHNSWSGKSTAMASYATAKMTPKAHGSKATTDHGRPERRLR